MQKSGVQKRKYKDQEDQKDERRKQPYVVEKVFSITEHDGESKKGRGISIKIPQKVGKLLHFANSLGVALVVIRGDGDRVERNHPVVGFHLTTQVIHQ